MFVSFKPGVTPENVELVKNSLRTLMTPLQVRVAAVFALFVAGLGAMVYTYMNRRITQLNLLLAQESKNARGSAPVMDKEAMAQVVASAKKPLEERIQELEGQVRQLEESLRNSPDALQEVGKLRSQLSQSQLSVESVKKTIEEDKATITADKEKLRLKEQELEKRETSLGERETQLLAKEEGLDQKERELNQEKQQHASERETFGREKDKFREDQKQLIEDRKKLTEDRKTLTTDRETLEREQEQLKTAKKELETKETELKAKETTLTALEGQLTKKGAALAEKERTLEAQQKEYTTRLDDVVKREQNALANEPHLAQAASRVDRLTRELADKQQLLDEATQTQQKLIEAESEIQRLKTEVARLTELTQEQDDLGDGNGSDLEGVLASGEAAQQRRLLQLQKSSSNSKIPVPPSPTRNTPPVPRTQMAGMLKVKKDCKELEVGGRQLAAISWPYLKKDNPRYGMANAQEIIFKVGLQEHNASVFSLLDISVKSIASAVTKKVLECLKNSFEEQLVQDYSDEQIEQALRKAMQKIPEGFSFKNKPNQAMATIAILLNNKVWVCTTGSTRTVLYNSKQEIVRLSERFDPSQIKVNEGDKLWITSDVTVKSYSLEDAKDGWLILTNGVFYDLYASEQIKNLVDDQLKRVPSSSPKDIADHMMTTVLQLLGTDTYSKLLGHVDALVVKL